MILQLDQRFFGHAETVIRLSSLLQANAVTANFYEVEPAVSLFLACGRHYGGPQDQNTQFNRNYFKLIKKTRN